MTDREWMLHAKCRGADTEIFFPDVRGRDGGETAKAQALWFCRRCPVTTPCLNYAKALHVSDGIYGGKFFHRKTPSPSRRDYQPCGTIAAYRRHHRRGETPCQACAEAKARDRIDRRMVATT